MNFLMIWSASTIVSVYTVFKQVFKMIKDIIKIHLRNLDGIYL